LFVCELAALMTNKYAASLPLFFIFLFFGYFLGALSVACEISLPG